MSSHDSNSGPSHPAHHILPTSGSGNTSPKPHHGGHGENGGGGGLLTIHHEGESGRSGVHPVSFLRILFRSSSRVSMMVNVLWPLVPIAIVLHYLPGQHSHTLHKWVFATAYLGMIPAANLLGFAGQELARKMPKVAGILIETALGSVVEIVLFVILIAKHRDPEPGDDDNSAEEGNLIPVIQAAILGSILTNLLLCLGLCFFFGGIRQKTQTFHAAVSEVGSGLLLVAGFGLLIPSAFYSALKGETRPLGKFTVQKLQDDVLKMSQATSVILIVSFAIYIIFNARSQHSIFDEILEADELRDEDHAYDLAKEKLTFSECVLAIATSLFFVTLLAFFLVEQIELIVHSGVPDQFLGLILLPLVEKAAEHLTAIDEAWDGQMNFALYHCLGPSIQTALFNGPLVVIVGWLLGKKMDLNFEIFMVALLVLSILVVGNFLRDKESNYLEGALLVVSHALHLASLVCICIISFFPLPGCSQRGQD